MQPRKLKKNKFLIKCAIYLKSHIFYCILKDTNEMRSILMYDLTNPEIIKYLCSKYGFSFSKGMGQNFITDEDVPRRESSKSDPASEA